MDLGLKGRRAIVCAASRGLGHACALALAREGVEVVITGRDAASLEQAAADIRTETGAAIRTAAGDITTPEGRAAALALLPDPDILVNNAGGPPPGDFRDFTDADWQAALNANMLTPIAMIRAVIDDMIARNFGRIVNITSGSVRSPIPALGLSNGARAGLTGFVAGLSRQVAKHNVVINNLLPAPSPPTAWPDWPRPTTAPPRKKSPPVAKPTLPGASATRRNSAPPAPSYAPPTPATSSAKTGSWTGAQLIRRCSQYRALARGAWV